MALPAHLDRRHGDRFKVYRNNYFHGLSLTLRDAYPRVHRVVGEAFFMAMAKKFLADNPPGDRTLVLFGEGFPCFIDRFDPAGSVAYLADLARLERAALEVLHETDEPCFMPSDIERLGEALAEHCFKPHAATRLVRSAHPIVAIYEANATDTYSQQSAILGRAETALVTRPGFEVEVRCLLGADEVFIGQILSGAAVGEAFDAARRSDPSFDGGTAWKAILSGGVLRAL